MRKPANCLPQRGESSCFPVVPGLFHVAAGPGDDGHCRRRSESAVAFYGYFRRFHRGPVFIRMGFLKGAEKGHSSVDVRFFILNLAVFAALVLACPGNVWTARSFYVWLSVFNLLTVSVAWSVLSDVMKPGQMKRLFALVASGSSLGAMAGPAVTAALAGVAGLLWLFLAAAVFLALAMLAGMYLHRWRDGNSPEDAETGVRLPADCRERPLGGNPFAGASAVFRSPFLMGIGLFIILLAGTNTFLYFELMSVVASSFPDPVRQTQVFGAPDAGIRSAGRCCPGVYHAASGISGGTHCSEIRIGGVAGGCPRSYFPGFCMDGFRSGICRRGRGDGGTPHRGIRNGASRP